MNHNNVNYDIFILFYLLIILHSPVCLLLRYQTFMEFDKIIMFFLDLIVGHLLIKNKRYWLDKLKMR